MMTSKKLKELKNKYLSIFENKRSDVIYMIDTFIEVIENKEKLEKAIDILKSKIELPLENDFDVVNKDDIHLYRLRTKYLINEEEYKLLKEVLGNE